MDESAMALIDAYLDGDLDGAGIARFEAWLLADRQHQVAFAHAARIDTSLRVAVAARQDRQAPELESASHKQPARRLRVRRSNTRTPTRSWPRYAAGWMAAAALVMVACGVGWMNRSVHESVPVASAPVITASPTVAVTSPPHGQAVRVSAGAQCAGPCELTFDDGSRVQLEASGRLRIDHLTNDTGLTLLAGHLTADIAHQPSGASFKVATAHLTVAVVGTQFEVATDLSATSVAVGAGRVRVTDTHGTERLVSVGERAWAGAAGLAGRVLSVTPEPVTPEKATPDKNSFATLTAAAAVARPGDLILLLPGRHTGPLNDKLHSFITCRGTANQWITIAGSPGKRAVLVSGAWDALRCDDAAYLRITGLAITSDPAMADDIAGNGIHLMRCHHVTIDDCEITALGGDGLNTSRSDHLRILGNRVSGCGFRSVWSQGGIAICSSLAVDDAAGPHIEVIGNRISGSRINFPNRNTGSWEGSNGIGFYNQRPQDDGPDYPGFGPLLVASNNLCYDNDGAGIALYRVDHALITDNLLHYNGAGKGGTCELGLFSVSDVTVSRMLIVPRPGITSVITSPLIPQFHADIQVWSTDVSEPNRLDKSPYLTPCADEQTRSDFATLPGFPLVGLGVGPEVGATPSVPQP